MNKIKNIYTLLMLIALSVLTSCEMKNELEGKYNLKANEGLLDLNLVPKNAPATRNDAEGMDVNTFGVAIVDVTTGTVFRTYESYEKLKAALPIVVPTGTYKIIAKSGVLQEASRVPYFEGNSTIDVKQGIQSKAEVVCKLGTVKVSLKISDEFLSTFNDDYSIAVSNGKGGVMYFTKEELSSVYLSIPEAAVSVMITAKVTDKITGKDIQTSYTVTKPDDETLAGGDSFNVTIAPTEEDPGPDAPADPEKPKMGLKLDIDLTMDETGITVKVPTELIEESTPEEPEQPEQPEQPEVGGPTIEGAPRTIELTLPDPEAIVQVTMKASAGIKNLYILIEPGNADFKKAIDLAGLSNKFDLANLGDLKDVVEKSMEDGGIGLLSPGTIIKGQTEYVFDISSFIPMLGWFEEGTHKFKLQLVDNNDKSTEEVTLTIVLKNASES